MMHSLIRTAVLSSLHKDRRLFAALVLMASFTALHGCAHRHGQVGMKRLEVETLTVDDESRLQLKSQEAFVMPMLIGPALETKPPEYPASLLKDKLPPMTICVDVIVDAEGSPAEIKPVAHARNCTAQIAPSYGPFLEAVSHTIRQWRFEPALVCTFPPGMAPSEARCRAKNAAQLGIDVKKIPIILTYQFEFLQVDGKAVVRRQ